MKVFFSNILRILKNNEHLVQFYYFLTTKFPQHSSMHGFHNRILQRGNALSVKTFRKKLRKMVSVLYSPFECSFFTVISSIPTSYSGLSFAKKVQLTKNVNFSPYGNKEKSLSFFCRSSLHEILDIFIIHALNNYNNGATLDVLLS